MNEIALKPCTVEGLFYFNDMKIYLGFLVFFMNASYIVMLYSYAVGKPLEFLLLNATTMIFSYISYNLLKEEK